MSSLRSRIGCARHRVHGDQHVDHVPGQDGIARPQIARLEPTTGTCNVTDPDRPSVKPVVRSGPSAAICSAAGLQADRRARGEAGELPTRPGQRREGEGTGVEVAVAQRGRHADRGRERRACRETQRSHRHRRTQPVEQWFGSIHDVSRFNQKRYCKPTEPKSMLERPERAASPMWKKRSNPRRALSASVNLSRAPRPAMSPVPLAWVARHRAREGARRVQSGLPEPRARLAEDFETFAQRQPADCERVPVVGSKAGLHRARVGNHLPKL